MVVRLLEVACAVVAPHHVELLVARLADALAVVEPALVCGLRLVDRSDARAHVVGHEMARHPLAAIREVGLAARHQRLALHVEFDAPRPQLEVAIDQMSVVVEHDLALGNHEVDAGGVVAHDLLLGGGGVADVHRQVVLAGRPAFDARAVDLPLLEEHRDAVAVREVALGGLSGLLHSCVFVARLGEPGFDGFAGQPARFPRGGRWRPVVVHLRVSAHRHASEPAAGRPQLERVAGHGGVIVVGAWRPQQPAPLGLVVEQCRIGAGAQRIAHHADRIEGLGHAALGVESQRHRLEQGRLAALVAGGQHRLPGRHHLVAAPVVVDRARRQLQMVLVVVPPHVGPARPHQQRIPDVGRALA